MAKAGRLSIFAGAGDLVPHTIAAALAAGYKVQVLALVPRPDITTVKVVDAKLDNPLGIIWSLKVFRTTKIVMAGGIDLSDSAREGLIRFANGSAEKSESEPAVPVGDAALSALANVLKKMTGADLVGVHELAPELLSPEGAIAGPVLSDLDTAAFALKTARAIGALDIGQAAVVSGRRIIAVEDIGGTDALIKRVGELRQAGLAGDGSSALILAKAMKPQQPGFVDLPAFGSMTVENCAKAGIAAIVVEAGRSLLLQRADLVAAAEHLNISVHGMALTDD
jgi:DUF1009 family protein